MSFSTKLWQISSIFLTPVVALAEPAAGVGAGQAALGKLVLGLFAVLAVIYACAWAMKRLRLPNAFSNQALKIDSVINVGAREKIALLRIGDQQLLIGITPNSIQTLHVLPMEKSNADTTSFAQHLLQANAIASVNKAVEKECSE